MSQFTQKKLTAKALEKAIKASIKKEVSARGINVTTRQGNKELKFLTNKIARYSFDNLEQAKGDRVYHLYAIALFHNRT